MLFITLLIIAGPGSTIAQSQAARPATGQSTGIVAGRVKNAVTGQYLPNAQISVKGTDLVTFTDEFGTYRIVNVPAGPLVLEAFYTGLDSQQVPLALSPGQRLEHEFALTNVERYGKEEDTVQLSAFVVASSRLREGAALAINEQRFAPNIKNVVTTDEFGDVTGGNVAEYLNFLPGVNTIVNDQTGFVGNRGAGIRGFDSGMVGVTIDGGGSMANANQVTRQASFEWTSISNFSRIEVTKVPTPATPADSMGGSINMVSKSSFEREKAEFRYRLALTGNDRHMTLGKTAFSRGKAVRSIRPSFDFDYTLPVNKDFGIVVTGLVFSDFLTLASVSNDFRGSVSGVSDTPVTPTTPRLLSTNATESPRIESRRSVSSRADWRITPNSVLSFTGEFSEYESDRATMNFLNASVGANATPSPASGVRGSHGPDYTIGATGRGTVEVFSSDLVTPGYATSGRLAYRFDNGTWRIDAGYDHSISKSRRNPARENTFQTVRTQMSVHPGVRVVFEDIGRNYPGIPGTIRAFNNSNQEIDLTDPNSYNVNTGQLTDEKVIDKRRAARVNIRRAIDRFSFPLAIQAGGMQSFNLRDRYAYSWTYTYQGMNGDKTITPFLSDQHATFTSVHHGMVLPVIDANRAYSAWTNDPSLFTQTAAQEVAKVAAFRNSSWVLEETLQAAYAQAEMQLFRNRLRVLGGVRYERTGYDGAGLLFQPEAVWQRNADGSFARNQAGQRIRKPEAGAVGSMEELDLIRIHRGHQVDRSIDGFYPSLHLTYNVSRKFLARAAYAKTYGRPNFNDIVPNTTINEFDDISNGLGRITTRNISLKPWGAHNYDLSFEYYTDRGGVFTAGVFRKEVSDFFGDIIKDATAEDLVLLGLDPVQYLGYELRTTINAGDAVLNGVEVDIRHSLEPLGRWGKFFSVFANWTKVNLVADEEQVAQFTNFRPLTINGGVTFSRKPVTVLIRSNYRGDERKAARTVLAPDGYRYEESRTTTDVTATYEFRRQLSFFLNIRNLFDTDQIRTEYGSETPDYARPSRIASSGAHYTFGVRGSF